MKTYKFPVIFLSIFSITGLIFLISGIIWMISGVKFKETAVEISAEIVDINTYEDSDGDTSHRVYVNYSFNGTDYEHVQIHSYNSSMYVGKTISLLCDPKNPVNLQSSSSYIIGSVIFIFLGAVFALVGIIPCIKLIKRRIKRNKLLTSGQTLNATVDKIICNPNMHVNGQHPYVIYCSYYDAYKDITYRFKSDNLWTNPEPAITCGGYIDVRVDTNDYSIYYVDADSAINGRIADYT